MAKQIDEGTKITLDLKTIGILLFFVATVIGMWFTLQSDIEEAKELPVPAISRTEYDLKDELIRQTILDTQDDVDKILEDKKSYGSHLGGNVYCNVGENSVCVDIRQYWQPAKEVVPTRKGICLRPEEYKQLKEHMQDIGRALPELDAVVPCYLQIDHMNQLGALQCSECNPNSFTTW